MEDKTQARNDTEDLFIARRWVLKNLGASIMTMQHFTVLSIDGTWGKLNTLFEIWLNRNVDTL